MSNYLIKIGNLYYAGAHDYTAEQEERKPSVEYLKSPAVVADALQAIIDEYGERKARELLMVSNYTFDKILNGRADDVLFRLILNTLKTMINLGRREVQMYMNYRRDLEYKVKG